MHYEVNVTFALSTDSFQDATAPLWRQASVLKFSEISNKEIDEVVSLGF